MVSANANMPPQFPPAQPPPTQQLQLPQQNLLHLTLADLFAGFQRNLQSQIVPAHCTLGGGQPPQLLQPGASIGQPLQLPQAIPQSHDVQSLPFQRQQETTNTHCTLGSGRPPQLVHPSGKVGPGRPPQLPQSFQQNFGYQGRLFL